MISVHDHAYHVITSTPHCCRQRKDYKDDEPFLTATPTDGQEEGGFPLSAPLMMALNMAAGQLERTLGRQLYPMSIKAVDFKPFLSPRQLAGKQLADVATRPYSL